MVDKGIAQLVCPPLDISPSEQCKREYSATLEQHSADFSSHYEQKKIEESRKLIDKILAGKRKKIAKSGGNPDDVNEETVLDEIRKRCQFDSGNILVQVPTQEPFITGEE